MLKVVKQQMTSPYDNFMNDPFLRRFFGVPDHNDGQEQEKSFSSLGSGFVISEDGNVITNNLVIDGAEKIVKNENVLLYT